jgi:hypothetical protein
VEWGITQESIQHLYDSVPKRLLECIQKRESYIILNKKENYVEAIEIMIKFFFIRERIRQDKTFLRNFWRGTVEFLLQYLFFFHE